jgi:hypothetical protein
MPYTHRLLRTLTLTSLLLLPVVGQASELTTLRLLVAQHREVLTLYRATVARNPAVGMADVPRLAQNAVVLARAEKTLAQAEAWCRAQRVTYHAYNGRRYVAQLTPACQEDTP